MRYILDTNICVHWLRGQFHISEALNEHGLENCCISEITKAELLFGEKLAQSKGVKVNSDALRLLFKYLKVVPISFSLDLYAQQKVRLRLMGLPIEDNDLWIATTATALGMTLVTDNIEHMSRVEGVKIENWTLR